MPQKTTSLDIQEAGSPKRSVMDIWDKKEERYFQVLGMISRRENTFFPGTQVIDPEGREKLIEERDKLYEELWGEIDRDIDRRSREDA